MKALTNLAAAAFLIALTIGIFVWTKAPELSVFNFDDRPAINWNMPVLSALLMLAGVVFGALYTELQRDDEQPLEAMKRALSKPSLYRALLVAPIVFGGVYAFARSNSDGIIVAIFAFQNGFFCESIFRKSTGTPTPAKP